MFKVGDTVRRTVKSLWPEQYGEVGVEYEVRHVTKHGSIEVVEGSRGADSKAFDLVVTDNNSKDTTAMTTSKFTETTTKTTIKGVIDGSLSNGALVSIASYPEAGVIYLVVGAKHSSEYKSQFDKLSLQELINELQSVHDVMEDY
jgi:hypothetical protein